MPRQTRKITIAQAVDISAPFEWIYKLNANFGFSLQVIWTSVTGSTDIRLEESTDGVNWSTRWVSTPDGKKRIETVPIPSGSDNVIIEVNNWRADYIRLTIPAATSGTIDAVIDMQENNNVY